MKASLVHKSMQAQISRAGQEIAFGRLQRDVRKASLRETRCKSYKCFMSVDLIGMNQQDEASTPPPLLGRGQAVIVSALLGNALGIQTSSVACAMRVIHK
jgi:hypothetical protein